MSEQSGGNQPAETMSNIKTEFHAVELMAQGTGMRQGEFDFCTAPKQCLVDCYPLSYVGKMIFRCGTGYVSSE